jgi:hypothetical protein
MQQLKCDWNKNFWYLNFVDMGYNKKKVN